MLLIFWASNIGAIEKMNTVKDIYENTNIGAYPWNFCENWKERVSRPINYLYIYIYVIRHRAHGSNKYHVEVNSRHDLHCQHKGNRTATDTSKSNWALFFPKILNIKLSYHMAIPILGIYVREMKHTSTQRLAQKDSWQHYT